MRQEKLSLPFKLRVVLLLDRVSGLVASSARSVSGLAFVAALTASFLGLPRLLLLPISSLFVVSPESVIRLGCFVSSGPICSLNFRYSSELYILNDPRARFI